MMIPSETSFVTDAKSAFSFLVDKQGYSVTTDKNEVVTFMGNCLAVSVYRHPRSYMIYIDIRRNDTGEEYSLYEILHALAPEHESASQCSGADEQRAKRCLRQLSQLCEQHLQGFLAMDGATLAKVASSARSTRAQRTLDAQYGAIKDRANEAWERKDWEEARELYEQARPGLSTAEERRLDFLLKKGP